MMEEFQENINDRTMLNMLHFFTLTHQHMHVILSCSFLNLRVLNVTVHVTQGVINERESLVGDFKKEQ